MKISYTMDINSKVEKVFPWIDDPERAKQWMTSVSKGEILNETPERIGTTFKETVEENGCGTELYGEITGYILNKFMSFHLEGRFNAVDVEYHLEEIEGRTRLTFSSDVSFKSFTKVLMLIMGPLFKKKTTDQLQKEFARLKELCENGAYI